MKRYNPGIFHGIATAVELSTGDFHKVKDVAEVMAAKDASHCTLMLGLESRMKIDIDRQASEIKILRTQIESAQRGKGVVQRQLDDARNDVKELKKEKAQLEETVDITTRSLDHFKDICEARFQNIISLEKEKAELIEHRDHVDENLEALEEMLEVLETAIRASGKEKLDLLIKNEKLQQRNDAQYNTIKSYQLRVQDYEGLKTNLGILNVTVSELKQKNRELDEELYNKRIEIESLVNGFNLINFENTDLKLANGLLTDTIKLIIAKMSE